MAPSVAAPPPAPSGGRRPRPLAPAPESWINQFICGDSLEGIRKLPDKSVDHTITDPPYEKHTHTKAVRHAGKKKDGEYKGTHIEDFGFEHITEVQRQAIAKEIVRVTKGWALVFCEDDAMKAWRSALEAAGAKWRRYCQWVKTNAMPKLHGDGPGQGNEVFVAVWCGEGRSVWNRGGRSNIWSYAKSNGGIHKTGKPLPLMDDLVLSFTKPGEIILDAYTGGATTLISAKRAGRRYVGWELSEDMHRKASKELASAREQLSMLEQFFENDTTLRSSAFVNEEDDSEEEDSEQLSLAGL